MATRTRVRAPELAGAGGWINTEAPLSLANLRGRVVLLDFWTFCCINCIHVIEELRPLEHRFGERLAVIGVHSPKFPHEQDHAAVERAVRRHRIEHPVLDDPEMETWQRYGVRAWPTLVVIDPEGYAVAMASGEGNGEAVGQVIETLLAEAPAAGDLPALPIAAFQEPAAETDLSFPGKVASDGMGRLAIADTGHDRVLVTTLDGVIESVTGGFDQPQGVRFDGARLLVCDTVGGNLTAVDLASGTKTVLARGLSSPWDVVRDGDRLVVAEAGRHRLMAVPADGGEAVPCAGSGAEGLRDGDAAAAHLAQPSGLTRLDGGAIAFADSEVSALRLLDGGAVRTLVGEGLFEWGDADGRGGDARLQHPLGVAALPGGAIAVADTFNSRLRIWRDGRLATITAATELDEPGGLDVLPDGRLAIADTGHHRILLVDPETGAATAVALHRESPPPLTGTAATELELDVHLDLGGEALDPQNGPPLRVTVSAEPPTLLGPGPRAWALDSLPARVSVPLGTAGAGELTVDAVAATCHGDVCSIRRSTRTHRLTVD